MEAFIIKTSISWGSFGVEVSWLAFEPFVHPEVKHLLLPNSMLRESILELAQKFESAQGWASERVFSAWMAKQEWRKCLPPIFEFSVQRVASLKFINEYVFGFDGVHVPINLKSGFVISYFIPFNCFSSEEFDVVWSEANATVDSRMDSVKLGIFLPHEIVASFYDFRSGDLFYSMLTGTPAVS